MRSQSIAALAKALSLAQAEITGAKKDSVNPFFKANYADLQSVWDACRAALTKNGLSITQIIDMDQSGHSILTTTLMHESGEFQDGSVRLTPKDESPQALGSYISYMRRYALAAMVGVYQTDDDAEAAQEKQRNAPPAKNEPYRIPFGKFKGKTLGEVTVEELRDYAEYIRNTAEKENKPINDTVQELLERIHAL
jgi:hypothetical protein